MRDVKMANAMVIFFYFGTRRDRKLIVVDSSCHGNLGDEVTPEIFFSMVGCRRTLSLPKFILLTSNWQGKGLSHFK